MLRCVWFQTPPISERGLAGDVRQPSTSYDMVWHQKYRALLDASWEPQTQSFRQQPPAPLEATEDLMEVLKLYHTYNSTDKKLYQHPGGPVQRGGGIMSNVTMMDQIQGSNPKQ